jgi:cardiolipin synthase
MIPKRADNWITNLGSHSYVADLLRAGVKVYFYKKGFLHAKLIVSDDKLSTVGSTNIDFRSFEHNFEVNAFLYDTNTALRMREIFIRDQHQSTQIYLRHWQKRPLRNRVMESFIRLFSPLL